MVPNDVLAAALVWLRNHFDRGGDRQMRDRVLARIDAVLADADPTVAGMDRLREDYPVAGTPIVPRCKNDPLQVEIGLDGSCLRCGGKSGEACR